MEHDLGCRHRRFEFASLEFPYYCKPPLIVACSYSCPGEYALESPDQFSAETWPSWYLLHHSHHHGLCNSPCSGCKFLQPTARRDVVVYVELN